MFFNVSAGDQLQIGESVTLTVLAVEGGLVHFGFEAPGLPHAGCPAENREQTGPARPRGWWTWN